MARRFKDPQPGERIHKTIFTWILQTKMKKGMIHDEVFEVGSRRPASGASRDKHRD